MFSFGAEWGDKSRQAKNGAFRESYSFVWGFCDVLVHFSPWIPCFLCSAVPVLIPSSAFFPPVYVFLLCFLWVIPLQPFCFCLLPSLEWGGDCLCYTVFLWTSPLPLALVFFVASSRRSTVCSPNVLSVLKPYSLVFKYTVGVWLTLHLYSSMNIHRCCNFFASQSCGLLRDAYCFSLRDFYPALKVISVSE